MYVHNRYDKLQKLIFIAFAQALLLAMGDTRKVVRFHPTELIIPTFQDKLMDGVLELDDGTLLNIEFITGNVSEEFLLRCAQYAVNLRVISAKHVETKILSTGLRINSQKIAVISERFKFEPELFFYSEFDGLEKLINIKNKIKNKEKLSTTDHFDLIVIPLMGNVDRVKAAFEVFEIVNNDEAFSKEEQSRIKRCQYLVANIVADGDVELYNKLVRRIKMLTLFINYLEEHEDELLEGVKEHFKDEIKEDIISENSIEIAKNLKDVLPDIEISKRTGLPIERVREL